MKAKIFYSYSHKDEVFREKLETHLSILRRTNYIEEWHDRRIAPGSNWEEEINENINEADIILLLVSSNFLSSDYCYDTETIRALERHNNKEATVIPIIIQPCLWKISKFADLKIQALPKDAQPITIWDNEEEAWLDVAEGIMKVAIDVNSKKKTKDKTITKAIHEFMNPSALEEDLIKFLTNYSNWYFSPLRIVKWGGRQNDYKMFSNYSSAEVSSVLKKLEDKGVIKMTLSQKGNPIYKIIK
jgi:hypothetical protein